MPAPLPLLAAVVLLAFLVESSLGFGSALIAVSLGSLIIGVDSLLPAFLPLNLLLSTYITLRYRRAIAWRLLARRVLPAMLLGLPLGLFAFRALPEPTLRRLLGAFVLLLSILELARLRRSAEPPARPGALSSIGLLVLGGIAHGAFATGGPLAVYVVGRELGEDKSAFRATLSALWLVLNLAMLASYAFMGRLGVESTRTSLELIFPLVLGLVVGEIVHAKLPMRLFKLVVFVMVGVAGVVLLVRR